MAATAILSMIVSNTATTLIMMPIGLAVLRAAQGRAGPYRRLRRRAGDGHRLRRDDRRVRHPGRLADQCDRRRDHRESDRLPIDFLTWALYGIPLVLVSIPLCWLILMKVQRVQPTDFDPAAARAGIGEAGAWSIAEKRLVPLVALVVAAGSLCPFVVPYFPKDSVTDGTIAVAGALAPVRHPRRHRPGDPQLGGGEPGALGRDHDVRRRPRARRRDRRSPGLADWLGVALQPLRAVHPLIVAAVLVAIVILITEFASNVATASGIIPVVGGMIAATGIDPILLALPAAFAASWGFMLPSGTGPNAIAWATGHIALPRMLKAGLLLDLAGVPLMVGIVWMIAALMRLGAPDPPLGRTRRPSGRLEGADGDNARWKTNPTSPARPRAAAQARRARDRRPQAEALDPDDGPRLRSGACRKAR